MAKKNTQRDINQQVRILKKSRRNKEEEERNKKRTRKMMEAKAAKLAKELKNDGTASGFSRSDAVLLVAVAFAKAIIKADAEPDDEGEAEDET